MATLAPKLADGNPTDPQSLREDALMLQAQHDPHDDPLRCTESVYMSFFFDGTRNNKEADTAQWKHSNVARLHNVCKVHGPEVKIPRFFRSYAAGVGTRFDGLEESGDPGVGNFATAGAASAWGGEGRINWALLQLQNNLHYRYFKITLSAAMRVHDRDLVQRMSGDMQRSAQDIAVLAKSKSAIVQPGSAADIAQRRDASKLGKLGSIAAEHLWAPDHAERLAVLTERNAELKKRLAISLQNKPTVKQIRLYVYGFSRGAAEARTFLHWLRDVCWDKTSHNLQLCGIPLTVEFVGLFDSVASVGVAQSAHIADGHGGWAGGHSQQLPSYVRHCLHLVAAHEVRGSFPVDLCAGAEEVIYPGVHSDVGGGYQPGEQGKGVSDADKLSQIPLCHMYRAARLAGAPLSLHDSRVLQRDRDAFKVSDALRQRFNAYLDACAALQATQQPAPQRDATRDSHRDGTRDGQRDASRDTAHGATPTLPATAHPVSNDARTLMQQQYGLYLRWRRARLDNLIKQGFYARSNAQDRADLYFANKELAQQAAELQRKKAGVDSKPESMGITDLTGQMGYLLGQQITKGLNPELQQYEEVLPYWNTPLGNSDADHKLAALFDEHVHDSRAWFKPFGDDDDVWRDKKKQEIRELEKRTQPRQTVYGELVFPLSQQEQARLNKARQAKNEAELEAQLPTQNDGREPALAGWGYLRWRTTYPHPQCSVAQMEKDDRTQLLLDEVQRAQQNDPWGVYAQ